MDFDVSKENIQPLRGGRNISQLGVALEAQTSSEQQRELIQQREEFEMLIRTGSEDGDPLAHWYHYISWIEQSYPKHGHEGNLVALLERCLGKFENDKRYLDDRRFCKLWIKYNDLQQNPVELYHMMYARGLCKHCSDLYRAWAYYHEAAGDYLTANHVFECGKAALAQPYDELEMAHKNLITAAGRHLLYGTAASNLMERRQALTSLQTYRPGKVGSIRTGVAGPGTLPVASTSGGGGGRPSNLGATAAATNVPIYQDRGDETRGGAEAAPISILSAAKRGEAPKENTLKPRPWTTVGVNKQLTAGKHAVVPGFVVHEDGNSSSGSSTGLNTSGLNMPAGYPKNTLETYTKWHVLLTIDEPKDDRMLAMYPKEKVYANSVNNMEYSLEELRAVKYLSNNCRSSNSINVSNNNRNQQQLNIDEELSSGNNSAVAGITTTTTTTNRSMIPSEPTPKQPDSNNDGGLLVRKSVFTQQEASETLLTLHQSSVSFNQSLVPPSIQPSFSAPPQQQTNNNSNKFDIWDSPILSSANVVVAAPSSSSVNFPIYEQSASQQPLVCREQIEPRVVPPSFSVPPQQQQQNNNSNKFNIWDSSDTTLPNLTSAVVVSPPAVNFQIYEQSSLHQPLLRREQIEPRGSAMKTPFKQLNADDLAETGSRGGMDIGMAAQPIDSAKRLSDFDDDDDDDDDVLLIGTDNNDYNNAPTIIIDNDNEGAVGGAAIFDLTCNTQQFNFNLNQMQVSTPQSKQQFTIYQEDCGKRTRKSLFDNNDHQQVSENVTTTYDDDDDDQNNINKVLSPILEETKSYRSSSSSSGATTKSSLFVSNHTTKQTNMATISEEHNSYLAQNLMANAALRSSLLGDIMDFDQEETSPQLALVGNNINNNNNNRSINKISENNNSLRNNNKNERQDMKQHQQLVEPLEFIPSDPFKPAIINELLQRVSFPGPYTRGYYIVNSIPKIFVRKDACTIGSDRYVIEKQLGKGTFGTVFRGLDLKTNSTVALKLQKPANKWEFYICRELRNRLGDDHPLKNHFMDVKVGYFSDLASVLISEFIPCGSLLDVANIVKQKTGRTLKESLCIYFCLTMLNVVQTMHDVKIIHADIKPDNFLVQLYPDDTVGLQLIDFGCSIDMTLFPPNASFTRCITTQNFVCCEMKDGRRWNYHTDLFCVAATAHVLLFDKYICLVKRDGNWSIMNRLPRYLRLDLWNMFFSTLLNQDKGPADSYALQTMLNDTLKSKPDDYHLDMRYLVNMLRDR